MKLWKRIKSWEIVSNRTKRKFDAHLTFDTETAKIGFDFPPRPAKKAAKAKE